MPDDPMHRQGKINLVLGWGKRGDHRWTRRRRRRSRARQSRPLVVVQKAKGTFKGTRLPKPRFSHSTLAATRSRQSRRDRETPNDTHARFRASPLWRPGIAKQR